MFVLKFRASGLSFLLKGSIKIPLYPPLKKGEEKTLNLYLVVPSFRKGGNKLGSTFKVPPFLKKVFCIPLFSKEGLG
jgi:hypothetical protein